MGLTFTPDRPKAAQGESVTFQMAYRNDGAADLVGLVLEIVVPRGFTMPMGTITWPAEDLAAGATRSGNLATSVSWAATLADSPMVVTANARLLSGGLLLEQKAVSVALSFIVSPVSAVKLVVTPAGPQPSGTVVLLLATATGGTAPVQYQFWWTPDGSNPATATWLPLSGWQTDNMLTIHLDVAAHPNARLGVWAKAAGSTTTTFEVSDQLVYPITPPVVVPPPPPKLLSMADIKAGLLRIDAAMKARGLT